MAVNEGPHLGVGCRPCQIGSPVAFLSVLLLNMENMVMSVECMIMMHSIKGRCYLLLPSSLYAVQTSLPVEGELPCG